MAVYNRQSILTTRGNYPVAAAGRNVFPDGSTSPNALAGELLVISNGVTIGLADIPTAKNIKIAVGMGPAGGPATDLRYVGGEDIDLCNTTLSVRPTVPNCGSPQVVDVFFNGCITPNSVYSLAINLDDSYIRSHYPENDKAVYIFSASTDVCSGCDDCNPSFDCADLVCKFVDQINGVTQSDPTKITRFIGKDLASQYQPFRAARLFLTTLGGSPNTLREFCLTPTSSACENCDTLPGIVSVRLDEETFTINGATLANDPTVMRNTQVKQLVSELNRILKPTGGSAHLVQGVGSCCNFSIHVSACQDVILLNTTTGTIAPCAATSPFTPIDRENVCRSCNVAASQVNPTCGLRLYVDPVEVPCNCAYPPNLPAPNYYGRTIDVQALGDNWGCSTLYVKTTNEQVLPEGFGYFWQDYAHYGQHRGGGGRDFRYNNVHRGNIGLPDEWSRATNAAAGIDCEETYCVYNIVSRVQGDVFFNNAGVNVNHNIDYLLVPASDTVTKLSLEPILAALQARGICAPGSVVCP